MVWQHPEPELIIKHHTTVFGPPGDNRLRRLKSHDAEHWYLFDRSGRAVARIEPVVLARAIAGVLE